MRSSAQQMDYGRCVTPRSSTWPAVPERAALAAAEAGAQVTGVDLTAELIAIAAERPGADAVQWVVADAAHTGLPDGGFSTVVSNMGIIFVEPTSLVAEVTRLLTPGGVRVLHLGPR